MKEIMKSYREDVLVKLEFKVIKVRDYCKKQSATGQMKSSLLLPKSDVLYFELEDDAWCAVRPSEQNQKSRFILV